MKVTFIQDDELFAIDVPVHVKERTFENFCDFRTHEREYIRLGRPPELLDDGSNKEEVESWVFPLEDVMAALVLAVEQMVFGDVIDLPFRLEKDDIHKLTAAKYQVKPGDDLSILRLYAHLVTIIQDFSPGRIPETYIPGS